MKVSELIPGDLIDLEQDDYADPDGTNQFLSANYAHIENIKPVSNVLTKLTVTTLGEITLPSDHTVTLISRARSVA